MAAWAAVQCGDDNPLVDLLAADPEVTAYLPPEQIRAIIHEGAGVGDAPQRSREMAARMRQAIA
jgi:adenylosuccinate lyase